MFESLSIQDGVTSIGGYTFYGCSGFTEDLTIPSGITNIGEEAFRDCCFSGTLTIPSSVTSIGEWAFYGCSGFTGDLTIPSGVTSIGRWAFRDCSGFTGDLTNPGGVTSIGGYAFYNCKSIEFVKNYAKTQIVEDYAFDNLAASVALYGYPKNITFKTVAGERWKDINTIPNIVTLTNKNGGDLYPRTKGSAVYLPDGKTVEQALGGVSIWRGTQAEYDALTAKPANTVYCIVGGSIIVT